MLKRQHEQQSQTGEKSLTKQNNLNTELEKSLVDLRVQVKQETLIKELNTMKSVKKSDNQINQSIKDQTTAVQNEIKTLQSSETLIDKQMADALKQTQTTIPDQIHKVESETQIMRAQKKAINGEI